MAEPLRPRQTKEAATDMFSLQPPRYIPTLPIPAVTSILSARQLYGDKLPIKFFGDLANSVFADLTPVRHLFGGAREAPRCERLRSGSGWTAGARQRRAMLKLVASGIAQQSADSLKSPSPKPSPP